MRGILSSSFVVVSLAWSGHFFIESAHAESHAKGCSITEKLLACGDVRKRQDILANLSDPATTAALEEAQKTSGLFNTEMERELFRRSIERNRHAAHRYAKSQFRRYQRGRVSAEEYETVRNQYESAMVNYNKALVVFRSPTWFKQQRSRYAEGSE